MNIKVAAFTVSEKSSNTDKCNKDGIVHYILRSHRSEFTYCDVFLKDPEECFDLSKKCST